MPTEVTEGMKIWARLSERERQAAGLICQAKSNKEIAEAMGLSHGYVKNMVHKLYDKVGADSRVQLVLLLMRDWRDEPVKVG